MKKSKMFARFVSALFIMLMLIGSQKITAFAAKYGPVENVGYVGKEGAIYKPILNWNICGRIGRTWTEWNGDGTVYSDKHEHTIVRTDFSCGQEKYTLMKCYLENGDPEVGYYIVADIDTGEHVFVETKRVYPSGGKDGYIEKTCTRCGDVITECLPAESDENSGTENESDGRNNQDGTTDSDSNNPQQPTDDPSTVAKISISQAKVTLKKSLYIYDGAYKKPQVTSVVLNKKTLNKGTDYTVTYANNKKAGTASVIITGCGAYCDTCKKDFRIVKKGEKITPSGSKHVYTITGNNTVAFKGTSATGIIKIPSKIKAYGVTFKVTSIAAGALKGKSEVTGLTIPASVTSVGKNAFDGTAISNVKIYGNLTTIRAKAFYNKGGKCTYTIYSTGKKKYNAIVKKIKASSNTKSKLTFKYKKK